MAHIKNSTIDSIRARAQQAMDEGIVLHRVEGGTVVAQNPKSGKAYMVSHSECGCPGHRYHGVCKHRALLIITDAEEAFNRAVEQKFNGQARVA